MPNAQPHNHHTPKTNLYLPPDAMVENYKGVSGAELARYEEEAEPVEQMHLTVEEMYFEKRHGELIVSLAQRDGESFFNISIPVKADENWNGFADSLPRWE